jgi:excisionase family DNA binding protein
MSERLAYTVRESARLLSTSERTIRYAIKLGRLGFCRIGRRVVIPHSELEKLLKRGYVKPVQGFDPDEPIRPRKESTNSNAPSGELEASTRGTADTVP